MLSFNHLGRVGRLGNQLFQAAALQGIAKKKGYEFCIPPSEYKDQWKDHQLFEGFLLLNFTNHQMLSGNYYQEKQFHYDEDYVNNCPDNVNLYGYFQTEKYFEHIEDSIREDFTFKPEILQPCLEAYDSIGCSEAIALHVRRTDYVEKSVDHPPCGLDYYEAALGVFDDRLPVLVFSDDIEWCKHQKLFEPDRFMFSENTWNLVDLCMMTMCSHHIIANSSFSWWGSYLANSKKTVAPKKWFGDSGYTANHDTRDIYRKDWIVI